MRRKEREEGQEEERELDMTEKPWRRRREVNGKRK